MKIVSFSEFIKLPEGTLFMKYEPCVFGPLQSKGKACGYDFFYEEITYSVESTGDKDLSEKLLKAQESGENIKMDFNSTERDGCFNKKQLFAIYDKRDTEMLIDKLERCVGTAYI